VTVGRGADSTLGDLQFHFVANFPVIGHGHETTRPGGARVIRNQSDPKPHWANKPSGSVVTVYTHNRRRVETAACKLNLDWGRAGGNCPGIDGRRFEWRPFVGFARSLVIAHSGPTSECYIEYVAQLVDGIANEHPGKYGQCGDAVKVAWCTDARSTLNSRTENEVQSCRESATLRRPKQIPETPRAAQSTVADESDERLNEVDACS
jgi:hypothetical protein